MSTVQAGQCSVPGRGWGVHTLYEVPLCAMRVVKRSYTACPVVFNNSWCAKDSTLVVIREHYCSLHVACLWSMERKTSISTKGGVYQGCLMLKVNDRHDKDFTNSRLFELSWEMGDLYLEEWWQRITEHIMTCSDVFWSDEAIQNFAGTFETIQQTLGRNPKLRTRT